LLIAFKPGNRYDPWKMKTTFPRLFLALVLLASATSLSADDFRSKIIDQNGTLPNPIHVPDGQYLVIRNFTQDGGTMRGLVNVYLIATGQSADVLAATIIDQNNPPALEVMNRLVVAGPANVTVTCGDGTNCFITYKKESD
jgi:hypothetical protein